jgi:hypothetical protein
MQTEPIPHKAQEPVQVQLTQQALEQELLLVSELVQLTQQALEQELVQVLEPVQV